MVSFKSSSLFLHSLSALLVLTTLSSAAVNAGFVEMEIDTDEHTQPPKNAAYACVIKSTSCKSTSHFTSDVTYSPALNVTTCHHNGPLRNMWNRVVPWSDGHGMFVNTFYVADVQSDVSRTKADCDVSKLGKKTANDIRDVSSEVREDCRDTTSRELWILISTSTL